MTPPTGRPVTIASHGLVTSPHYLASQAGLHMLRGGGNAVDAAVATAATLDVVMPHQTSLGGDAFWLIYTAASGQLIGLNASGRSPYGLSPETLHAKNLTEMPVRGPLPVTVPGAVAGWDTALASHGTMPLARVLAPAIDYAENGFPLNVELVKAIAQYEDELAHFQSWRDTFLPQGRRPAVGERFRQPQLGQTLRLLAQDGASTFYRGDIAQKIVDCVQRAGGMLAAQDLAEHYVEWVAPLNTTYRGHTIYEMPPNSRGAIALAALNILEGVEVASAGFQTAATTHLLLEAYRLAAAQLEPVCSDPDFSRIGSAALNRLISKEFAGQLRAELALDQATPFTAETGTNTVYLAVVDGQGNAVSLIESSYYTFGSGLVVEEAGFVLQNRGAHFSLDPNSPNSLAPHKRTLHTLMPAMAFRDGRPWLVFGSMGGTGQAQTQLQLLTNIIDFGLNVQQAIEAPRWVKGATLAGQFNDDLRIENRLPVTTQQALTAMGYRLARLGAWSDRTGQAHAILIDQAERVLHGAADPRSEGLAAGW